MSLGMMSMSPTIISLPFKLLLFVLVDGLGAADGQSCHELCLKGAYMQEDAQLLALADQTLWVTALIAGPVLIAALVVGLVVGIIQAATSVNEQTLSFIPKLAVTALVFVVLGGAR